MMPQPILKTLLLASGLLCGIGYGAAANLLPSGYISGTESPVVGPDPVFDFSFTVGPDAGFGSLNTVDIGGGAFAAIGGSLTVTSGIDVGSYVLFSGGPGVTISPAGAFAFDDVLYPASNPYLDVWGLLFTAGGLEINIWGNSADNYSFYSHSNSAYNVADTADAPFNATLIPEPSSLWLLGAALLGMGVFRHLVKDFHHLAESVRRKAGPYRFTFSAERRTRCTDKGAIHNMRAIAAGFTPALKEVRTRFAFPLGSRPTCRGS
jgi:hypothetical protein